MPPDFAKPQTAYAHTFVLAVDPMVAYADAVLSPEECAHIMQQAQSRIQRAKVSLDEGAEIIPGRSGSNCWLRYADDPMIQAIGERLSAIVGIPLSHAEALQVIHYGPQEEYRPHYDAYDLSTQRGQRACKYGGQRIVTGLLYLNAVEAGGATVFPRLHIEVQPKPGRLVLFNNIGDDLTLPHPQSLHAGTPVLQGEKWACNVWFHTRPLREVQDFAPYLALRPAKTLPTSVAGVSVQTPTTKSFSSRDEGVGVRAKILQGSAEQLPSGLILRCNRATSLLRAALQHVESALPEPLQPPVCFSFWDTFGNQPLERSDLPPEVRLLELIERPIANVLADKGRLAQRLQQFGLEHWAPRSFRSVSEALAWDADPDKIWFHKPVFRTGGRGMYCIRGQDLAGHELPAHHILQEEVTGLELVQGRKCVCRVYLLLWQRQVWLYQDGFYLLHGVPWQPGSTDYAVQIDHHGYQEPGAAVQMAPLSRHPRHADYWPAVRDLLRALAPVWNDALQATGSEHYLILGLDLLYRSDGQVRLVEINTAANFMHSTQVNREVNTPFFAEVLRLMLGMTAPGLELLDNC